MRKGEHWCCETMYYMRVMRFGVLWSSLACRFMLTVDTLMHVCSEKDLRIQETSIVHRLFGGYYRSQVKCCVCHYESNTYDCFLDLSLVRCGMCVYGDICMCGPRMTCDMRMSSYWLHYMNDMRHVTYRRKYSKSTPSSVH